MTVVKGDPKAPFLIATKPRCWRGRYSFPWIAPTLPLIHTLYCWVLSKEVSSTILKVFGMTRPGIEPRSPGPLANTLPIPKSCCSMNSLNSISPRSLSAIVQSRSSWRNLVSALSCIFLSHSIIFHLKLILSTNIMSILIHINRGIENETP